MASAYATPIVFERITGIDCFTVGPYDWARLRDRLKRYVIGHDLGEYQLCWNGQKIILRITNSTVAIYSGKGTTHLTSPSYEEFWQQLVEHITQLEAKPIKQPTHEEIIAHLMITQG